MPTLKYLFAGLLLLAAPAVFAELGPVDGHDLPGEALQRVVVDTPAPDFRLRASDGREVSLSDFRDRRDVILIFYRGHW